MSIYLEFPAIAEYPLYINPYKNDEQPEIPKRDEFLEAKEDKNTLQDYLTLRMI